MENRNKKKEKRKEKREKMNIKIYNISENRDQNFEDDGDSREITAPVALLKVIADWRLRTHIAGTDALFFFGILFEASCIQGAINDDEYHRQ
jgi:hypothetical protein